MNIFVLDKDPLVAATYHNDKHVVKMVVESLQLLSNAHNISGVNGPYKLTHKNHPCSIWTLNSLDNYKWLVNLFGALLAEYTFRYNKIHKCYQYLEFVETNFPNIPNKGLTPFVLAMPDECKTDNPVDSYRKYYITGKRHIAKWTNREIPPWYI